MKLEFQSLIIRQKAKLEQWLTVQSDKVESLNLDAMMELGGALSQEDLDGLAEEVEEVRTKHKKIATWLTEASADWNKLSFESHEEYTEAVSKVNDEALTFSKKAKWNTHVAEFFEAFTALQQNIKGLLKAKVTADKAALDASAKKCWFRGLFCQQLVISADC